VDLPEHTAARPLWECRWCGRAWPCEPARDRMLIEMDQVSLAIFMWLNLEEAAADMPREPASELFERFVHWTLPT
jgi:hypothetical protein